jgi:HTH-type transcriptional regulator/antitoxin HipB
MNSQDIPEMVKYFRKQSGLSQEALAKIAGIGKTVIFDIEKGKQTIQLESLLKVLEVLNIKMTFITPFPKPPASEK